MHKTYTISAFCLLLVLLPIGATANQLATFGTSPRAMSMAGAYTAIAEGTDALFYNPGALIQNMGPRLDIAYTYTLPALFLEQQESDGDSLAATNSVKEARRPETAQWISGGVVAPLNRYLYFGLYTQIPIDGQERRKWFSPSEPYFVDYETGIFGHTFIPGLAVKFASNIGLGLGVEVIFDAAGNQKIYIPIQQEEVPVESEGAGRIGAQAAPIIGFFARPFPELRLGLTYRGESYRKHKEEYVVEAVPGDYDSEIGVDYEVIYNFNPATLSFSAAYQPDERVLLALELMYEAWGRYFPPYPSIDLDFSDARNAGLALNQPDDVDPNDVKPSFHDTISPKFAVETRAYRNLFIDVGYKREPSSTAFQRGTASALDVDVNVLSFGMAVQFGGVHHDMVRLDGGIQAHFLSEEHATKLTEWMEESDPESNPLYPRYEVGGRFLSGGLSASMKF